MTAEIAVMNEEAIALAADSAVTGPGKIFTSANKIFALSKFHPVALMVFDNAQFLRVPWETIVKQYRRELGDKCFDTLEDHAEDFLSFFSKRNPVFPAESQEKAASTFAYNLFHTILDDALIRVEEMLEKDGEPTKDEVIREIEKIIALHRQRWKEASTRPGLPKSYKEMVAKKYKKAIDGAIKAVFEQVSLSAKAKRNLRQLIPEVASKDLRFERAPSHSGIVIAGFGRRDVFPRLRRYHFEAIFANRLKYTEEPGVDIGASWRAAIIPFAQAEQVHTFMGGIDPNLRVHLHNWWHEKLDDLVGEVADHLGLSKQKKALLDEAFEERCIKIVRDEYEGALDDFSAENNVSPITNIVGMLPKDELAEMAESLVNLTSFKRRVTPEAETVGGPIDVAVISRGDGFIWIKRKHYFNTELNPHFVANYNR